MVLSQMAVFANNTFYMRWRHCAVSQDIDRFELKLSAIIWHLEKGMEFFENAIRVYFDIGLPIRQQFIFFIKWLVFESFWWPVGIINSNFGSKRVNWPQLVPTGNQNDSHDHHCNFIFSKMFYVLNLFKNDEESTAQAYAISDFPLAFPALSYAVDKVETTKIKNKKFNKINCDISSDGECAGESISTMIQLFCIQTK